MLKFSTTTLVELPTTRGMGLANVVEDPPATPLLFDRAKYSHHAVAYQRSACLSRRKRAEGRNGGGGRRRGYSAMKSEIAYSDHWQ